MHDGVPDAQTAQGDAGWDWDHARLRAAPGDFFALSAEVFLDAYGG